MNTMNWDDFRFFVAAVEAGSLSGAAEALASNQSTVGRHIDALERALGVTLFQRSVKGLQLTGKGQAIFEQAQSISGSVMAIKRLAQSGEGVASGCVKLSLPEGLGQEVLIPMLDDFYRLYPDVKLVFNLSATTTNLRQDDADISIRLFRPEERDLDIRYLGDMKMGLYASASYEQSYGLPARLKDLRKFKVISYGEHLSILPENQWLLNHSTESLRVLHSDSTVTRFKATVSGIGISLQPAILAGTNPDLIRLFKAVKLPSHQVWLVCHQHSSHIPRIRAVLDFIHNRFADMLD